MAEAKVTSNLTDVEVKGDQNTAGMMTIHNTTNHYSLISSPTQNQPMTYQEFITHLTKTTKRYYKTKYKTFKLPFYDLNCDMDDIYINIHCERTHDDNPFSPRPVEAETKFETFKTLLTNQVRAGNRRFVIQGDGGMGKTTASMKICLDWSREDEELTRCFDVIVRVDLKTVKLENANSVELMAKAIEIALEFDMANVVPLDSVKMHLREILDNERVFFIFDGFDETSGHTKEALRSIFFPSNDMATLLSDVPMILLTRPQGLRAKETSNFTMRALNESQCRDFITRRFEQSLSVGSAHENREAKLLKFCAELPSVSQMTRIPFFLVMLCTLCIYDDFQLKLRNNVELLVLVLGFTLKSLLTKFERQTEMTGQLIDVVKKQLAIETVAEAASMDVLQKTDLEQLVLALGHAIFQLNEGVFSGSNDLSLEAVKCKIEEFLKYNSREGLSSINTSCGTDFILKLSWFSIETVRQKDGFAKCIRFQHQNLRDIIVAYYLARGNFTHVQKYQTPSVGNADMITFRGFLATLRCLDVKREESTLRIALACRTLCSFIRIGNNANFFFGLCIDICCVYTDWVDWDLSPNLEMILETIAQISLTVNEEIDVTPFLLFLRKSVEELRNETRSLIVNEQVWNRPPGVFLRLWPLDPVSFVNNYAFFQTNAKSDIIREYSGSRTRSWYPDAGPKSDRLYIFSAPPKFLVIPVAADVQIEMKPEVLPMFPNARRFVLPSLEEDYDWEEDHQIYSYALPIEVGATESTFPVSYISRSGLDLEPANALYHAVLSESSPNYRYFMSEYSTLIEKIS